MREAVTVILLTLLVPSLSDKNERSSSRRFSLHRRPTFIRLKIDVPLTFSSVYGKLEPVDHGWFILFEIDHSLFPSTYPAINEEIEAGDVASTCRRFEAVREIEIELELHSEFVRIRTANSERYEFPDDINLGHDFEITFYVQEYQDGPLCLMATQAEQVETSKFSVPLEPVTQPYPSLFLQSVEMSRSSQKMPSRRMLQGTTVTQSSRPWTGKLRLATYKANHRRSTSKPLNKAYIDIQKDREAFEAVQRSRTKEINSVWSTTFLTFLIIEVFVVGTFVFFGLSMFVLLQIRPKTNKHIEIVY